MIFIFKEVVEEQTQETEKKSSLECILVVSLASLVLSAYEMLESQVPGDGDHRKRPRQKEVLKGEEAPFPLRLFLRLFPPGVSHVPRPPLLCGSFSLGSR